MKLLHELEDLRTRLREWRTAGQRIALVPTMGNLHEGHITLAQEARKQADQVIATVFVNPTQFGPGEDYESYPHTLEQDAAKLEAAGVELLFAPSVETVYPNLHRGKADLMLVEPPQSLANILCGAFRPGHFRGVATVVAKLFNLTQPDVALFGEKDFQQLMVIRRLVEDLNFPIEIRGVPTVREPDGLAMSSRNGYLTGEERAIAPQLYASLQETARKLSAGTDADDLECAAIRHLDAAGFRTEYVSLRRAEDLGNPEPGDQDLVILAAARLGNARLIDNLRVTLS